MSDTANTRSSQRRERTGCGARPAPDGRDARDRQIGRNNSVRLRNRTDEWRRLAGETPLAAQLAPPANDTELGALLTRIIDPAQPLTESSAQLLGSDLCAAVDRGYVTAPGLLANNCAHLQQLIAVAQGYAVGQATAVARSALMVLSRCAASSLELAEACVRCGSMAVIGLIMKQTTSGVDQTVLYYALRLCGALVCAKEEYRRTLLDTGLLALVMSVLASATEAPTFVQCCYVLEMVCRATTAIELPVAIAVAHIAAELLSSQTGAVDDAITSVLRALSIVCEAGVDHIDCVLTRPELVRALGADAFTGSQERIAAHMRLCVSLGLGNDDQLAALYRSGVHTNAVRLLHSNNRGIATYAAQTLNNLLCGPLEQTVNLLRESARPLLLAATREDGAPKATAAAFTALLVGVTNALQYCANHSADPVAGTVRAEVLRLLHINTVLFNLAAVASVTDTPAAVLEEMAEAYALISGQAALSHDPELAMLGRALLPSELYDILTAYLGEEQHALAGNLVDCVAALLELYDTYGNEQAPSALDRLVLATHDIGVAPGAALIQSHAFVPPSAAQLSSLTLAATSATTATSSLAPATSFAATATPSLMIQ